MVYLRRRFAPTEDTRLVESSSTHVSGVSVVASCLGVSIDAEFVEEV